MNLDLSTKRTSRLSRFLSHVGISLLLVVGFGVLSYVINQRNQEALVNSIQAIFRNDRDIGNTAHLSRRVADMEALGILKCVKVVSDSLGVLYSTNFKDACDNRMILGDFFDPTAIGNLTSIEGDRYAISFKSEANAIYRFYIGLFFVLSLVIANALVALYWYRIDLQNKELETEHQLNRQLDFKVQQLANELVSVRLEAAVQRSIGEMARRVAHDIRSPLSALMSLVHHHSELDKDAYVDIVGQVSQRISDIADDLLDKSKKALAGKQNSEMQAFNLKTAAVKIFREKQIEYQGDAALKIDLQLEEISEELKVHFSESQFSRIASNIINNAVDALARRGSILVEGFRRGDEAIIKISDSGRGIAPELLNRLTTEEVSTKEKGSGIGIYYSYKALKEAGHDLNIESVLGSGTNVSLKFKISSEVFE